MNKLLKILKILGLFSINNTRYFTQQFNRGNIKDYTSYYCPLKARANAISNIKNSSDRIKF